MIPKDTVKGEILEDQTTTKKYSHDASIFEITPEAIIFPKDTEDLKKIVNFVSENKAANPNLSITARSAGTDMSGGAINDSIILDFTKYFNHLLEVGADYAITESGVYYRDFEKATLEKNLIMPSFPASRSLCAMGGIMSNNSGGEKSLSYGKTEKYLEEISAVLSDGHEYNFKPLNAQELKEKMALQNFEGEIYRKIFALINDNYEIIQKSKPNVTKNSAGYYLWNVYDKVTFDLTKLLVGSQGTLGLFTKGKFKLVKTTTHSKMLVIFLKDLKPLGELINTLMQFHPETLETFDDNTFKLAVKFLPAMMKKMGGNIFTLGWKFLPEVFMTITHGVPKLLIIAEFTGDSEAELTKIAQRAQFAVKEQFNLKTHITKNTQESQKYWTFRHESFNLLREKIKNLKTAPFIDDFIVHPHDLPEFLPRLDKIFAQYPELIYTIAGHAGDANFHIIPLMDLSQEKERKIIPKLSQEVYDLVLEYRGSITAEHNDGLIRGPYLEQMYGPKIFELFKQVKEIFDPLNIFNPHKKTDATKEYLESHIQKTI
ncbi:MAG: FAD-binding oxidoreductase [Candidatus Magasanikbacteria bacterium]|nr:FAD-binding oxidoreductase [Candidatus Magasanikbacteria bacterium]